MKQWLQALRASEFVKRFFGVFLLDVLAKGSVFLFLPLYMRLMTKEEFGAFAYLIFIIMNLSYFLKLGMDTAQSKLYFDYKQTGQSVMLFNVNIIPLVAFGFVLLVCVVFNLDIYFFRLAGVDQVVFSGSRWFIWVYVFAFMQQTMLQSYLVADNRAWKFQYYNFAKVLAMSIGSVAVLYFVATHKVRNRLMVESISGLLVFVPLSVYMVRHMKPVWSKAIVLRSLRIGLPMLGSVLVGFVYSFVDKYYLQKTHGFAEVAVYSVAIFLSMPVNLIFSSFSFVWISKFFGEKDILLNYRRTKKVYLTILAAFTLLFIGLWLAILVALRLNLIEASYHQVLLLLPIIFYYRVVESLSNLYTNFLIREEQTKLIFRITVAISILAWLLFAWCIPIYGYWAAAIILLGLELMRTGCLLYFTKKIVYSAVNGKPEKKGGEG